MEFRYDRERADPALEGRPTGEATRNEIPHPLGIEDCYLGAPREVLHRVVPLLPMEGAAAVTAGRVDGRA